MNNLENDSTATNPEVITGNPYDFTEEFDRHLAYEAMDSNNPQSAIELYYLMSDLSQKCTCSSWDIGCEYILWDIAEGEYTDYLLTPVDAVSIDKLRDLRQRSDGWWLADERPGRIFQFISVDNLREKIRVMNRGKQ